MRAWTIAVLCLLAAGCATRSPVSTDRSEGPASAEAIRRTQETGIPGKIPSNWFYRQRAAGPQRIPVKARSRALREARSMGDAPGVWDSAGPFNIGGRVTALAVDPNDPNRIWLGTAAGGVFVSADQGVSWTPVFDDQVALSIGSLVAHPTDSDIVYVGTGEDNGGGLSYDGEGVFKTTDGGQSWIDLGLGEVRRIGRMAIDPTDGDRLYVAAGGDWFNPDEHRGIYRTTDGGQAWQKVLFVDNDAGGIDVAVDPDDPTRIYASIWQRQSSGDSWYIGGAKSGIYRSTDGGDTWTELTAGLPASAGRIGLAVAPSNTLIVYANIISPSGALDGIYRSADRGDTWVKMSDASMVGEFTSYSYYFSQIRVDPTNHKTLYALDQRLHRSTDGGQSVQQIALSVHVDWHDLIVENGGRILAGTDGGFDISQDGGQTWTHAETLPITQFYDLGIDTLQPQRRFGGAQDNGTLRTTAAGLSDWTNVLGGDGLQCEVDFTDSSRVFASAQYGNLFRSVNGGDSFTSATSGIDPAERNNWNTPLFLDPVVPSTLYTGAQRVYRSTDGAVSWNPISPDLTLTAAANADEEHHGDHHHGNEQLRGWELAHLENLIRRTITVVSVSPVDTDVIWAGTDNGNLWVTDDGGSGWTQVNPPGLAFWVTDIAPDPFDAASAYVTVTGYREGDDMPYVRATRDLGQSWVDISGNLPQLPVNSVLADPTWQGRLFVGNDVGVYLSDDDGLSWSSMRGDLPYVVVMDLVRNDPTGSLWAGTHGRSIYRYDLAQLPDADGDGDGVDNNSDCALADPGAFAPPGDVDPLQVNRGPAGEALLDWPPLDVSAGAGTVYDVATGLLSDLVVSGLGGSISLSCATTLSAEIDSAILASGTGRYYVVRGRNACGIGGWGTDGTEGPRTIEVCP